MPRPARPRVLVEPPPPAEDTVVEVPDRVEVPDPPMLPAPEPPVGLPARVFVEDGRRPKRLRDIVRLLAECRALPEITKLIRRKYGVPAAQVEQDIADLAREARRQLDDEGNIDVALTYTVARNARMANDLYDIAMEPLPDPTKESPGAPPLTPTERSIAVASKVKAATAASQLAESNLALLGRRTEIRKGIPRTQVTTLNVDAKDLSPEQQEAMRRLMGE